MKKLYALFLAASAVSAQPSFTWLQTPSVTFSANTDLIAYVTASAGDGSSYIAGFQDQQYVYNDIMGRCFFKKYAGDGSAVFSKLLSGKVSVKALATDGQNNAIMLVNWISSFSLDDLQMETVDQGEQPLLLKFDASGNLLWHFTPTSSSPVAPYCETFALDAAGNIYIGYNADLDSYIQKISPDGIPGPAIVQENVFRISSVSVDDAGNIYAAGSCADVNSHFSGMPAPASGYNTYVVKYDADGVCQWVKYVEDITCPAPQVVARTPDAVYFSSYLFGAYAFDAIQAEGPTGSLMSDFFVAKLNAGGQFQWVREVPGEGMAEPGLRKFIFEDDGKNVYFAGRTQGAINWAPGVETDIEGFSSRKMLLLKYDTDGGIQFARIGGSDYARADGVSVNASGDIFVSGLAQGSGSFGSISHDAGTFENWPFLVKLNQNSLSVPGMASGGIALWPNPARGIIHLSNPDPVEGAIFNMLGQKVLAFQLDANASLDVGALPSGGYILRIAGKTLRFLRE